MKHTNVIYTVLLSFLSMRMYTIHLLSYSYITLFSVGKALSAYELHVDSYMCRSYNYELEKPYMIVTSKVPKISQNVSRLLE